MGVPPSPATKLLLDQGLNVVGKVVKTSKYKFADWNIKLPKGTTKLPDAEFKKLSRAAQFFREGYYTTEDIKKIQDAAKEAKSKVKEAEKLAKESKNLWDKFLSGTKGASQVAKASAAGKTVIKAGDTLIKLAPVVTALFAVGLTLVVNEIQGWRNDVNEDGQQLLSQSISKVLGLMNVQQQRINRANEGVKKAELENQRVRDRIYGVEKQLPGIVEGIINTSIQNFVKSIVGAENYTILSENWAKANRIYQATTNVLNSFQNISSTILSGMELISGQTGKIGNALRKSGEVLETAYGWMNPQPKFNRITQTLESLNQGASTIQQVTQVPLDIISATTELQNANAELVKAIKEDDKPASKGIEAPEPDKLKATEVVNKVASMGKDLAEADKEEDA